jgi:hypothetical protein
MVAPFLAVNTSNHSFNQPTVERYFIGAERDLKNRAARCVEFAKGPCYSAPQRGGEEAAPRAGDSKAPHQQPVSRHRRRRLK